MVIKKRKYTALPLSFYNNDELLPKHSPIREDKPKKEEPIKKKIQPCNYGLNCKRSNCVFMHPGEKIPPKEKEFKKDVQKTFKKTRMCKYAKKCGKGKNCPFAHHESEIYIPECRYGYKCKKQGKDGVRGECKFSHPILVKAKEEKFEFKVESFPTVNGFDVEPSNSTTIDFSCLADEDFSLIHETQIEESKGKCIIGGSIDNMMKIFETMEGQDIYQYSFTF